MTAALPGDVETLSFVLRLKPGAEAEYRRRHDALWPETRALLLSSDILETVEGIVPRVEPLERMFVLSADDKK